MLSRQTENIICNIFLLLNKQEEKINIIKKNFNDKPIIYFKLLFQKIDEEKNSLISYTNIINFLQRNSIYCTENEAKSIINIYDINRNNFLNYKEFLYFILLKEKLLDKRINFHFSYNNSELSLLNLPYNIEYDFCQILENELFLVRKLEENLNELNKRKDYNIHILFNELKDANKNEVSFEKLASLLKRNKIILKKDELKLLIKKLDIDKDGSITIDDLYIIFGKNISNSIIYHNDIENTEILNILKRKRQTNKENVNKLNNIKYKENIALNLILEFYLLLIEIERIIETEKKKLSQKTDFNIDDALQIFQKRSSNYISEEELKNGLHNLGVIVNNNEIKLLMKRFCTKEEDFLDNSDFFDMLVPFDINYREIIEKRKSLPYLNNKNIFSDLTRESLANLFKIIISCEITVEKKRKNLRENIDINYNNFFSEIDIENKGFIFISDFLSFFTGLDYNIEEKYIYLLFVRLDKKRKGKINQIDLINEITPKIKDI